MRLITSTLGSWAYFLRILGPGPRPSNPLDRFHSDMSTHRTDERRRLVCGVAVDLPEAVIAAADGMPGNKWLGVADRLSCPLEMHDADTQHYACVLMLADSDAAIWTHWVDGMEPIQLIALPDCPSLSPDDGGCTGFNGHPGGHSWETVRPRFAGEF